MSTDEAKFEIIFQEAEVIDLDFSKWDKYVRIVVVATMYPAGIDNRSQLFNVDFCDVGEFTWKSNHLGIKLDSPEHHCQWNIMKFKLDKVHDDYLIRLSDVGPPSPELTIRCRSIAITPLNWDLVFAANPAWRGTHLPLARPSLEALGTNKGDIY